ncbi:MAG: permease [Treponema sp.]|jgi:putative hydroxymethylpyrimidine transporter CytX|nr:permease [Treponema sp.]
MKNIRTPLKNSFFGGLSGFWKKPPSRDSSSEKKPGFSGEDAKSRAGFPDLSVMFLLWVGAAISISEIYTGGLLAPLGFGRGMAAIVIGHAAGTGLLALGGQVSFIRRRSAMESAAFSLGRNGGRLAALCNVVQLAGWTVVMVVQAGNAFTALFPLPFAPVSFALGLLVLLWALIFGSPARWINGAVVILLAVLCGVLFWESAGGGPGPAVFSEPLSFTLALELSIAMPVSWLPLAGDYSCRAKDTLCASVMPFAGYFLGSVFMYGFGLFIALETGGDFFTLIAASRFRLAACAVVVFSTLTTAFLDLYSAAVSSTRIVSVKKPRRPVLVLGLFAAIVAAVFPAESYSGFLTGFLTAIGAVFVPLYGVIFIDFFMKRPENKSPLGINLPGLAAAAGGTAVYMLCAKNGWGIPTLLAVAAVAILYIPVIAVAEKSVRRKRSVTDD